MTNNDEDSYQSWSSSHLEIRTYREEPANTGTGSYFYCKKEREPATEEDFTAIMQAFADDLGDIGPMDAVDQEIAELMTDPIFLL